MKKGRFMQYVATICGEWQYLNYTIHNFQMVADKLENYSVK